MSLIGPVLTEGITELAGVPTPHMDEAIRQEILSKEYLMYGLFGRDIHATRLVPC